MGLKIVLLKHEAALLHRLAEWQGLTPGETLRALIVTEAYRCGVAERTECMPTQEPKKVHNDKVQ